MNDLQQTFSTGKKSHGRPRTITIKVIEQIAVLIAKGMTEEQACCRVGVNHDSFCTARHRNGNKKGASRVLGRIVGRDRRQASATGEDEPGFWSAATERSLHAT